MNTEAARKATKSTHRMTKSWPTYSNKKNKSCLTHSNNGHLFWRLRKLAISFQSGLSGFCRGTYGVKGITTKLHSKQLHAKLSSSPMEGLSTTSHLKSNKVEQYLHFGCQNPVWCKPNSRVDLREQIWHRRQALHCAA